jgi:hypothetical protein
MKKKLRDVKEIREFFKYARKLVNLPRSQKFSTTPHLPKQTYKSFVTSIFNQAYVDEKNLLKN